MFGYSLWGLVATRSQCMRVSVSFRHGLAFGVLLRLGVVQAAYALPTSADCRKRHSLWMIRRARGLQFCTWHTPSPSGGSWLRWFDCITSPDPCVCCRPLLYLSLQRRHSVLARKTGRPLGTNLGTAMSGCTQLWNQMSQTCSWPSSSST
jgi:hypothetical protein